MTNEIKEIYLNNLEWTKTRDNDIKVNDDMGSVIGNIVFKDNMSYEEFQKLFKSDYFILCDKDYITNLQEEKENAVECLKYYEEKHFIKPAIDNTKLTIELYNAYSKEINDLQQRIDKAVEYINKYEYQKYCPGSYEKDKYIMKEEKEGQDLLDILRGDE